MRLHLLSLFWLLLLLLSLGLKSVIPSSQTHISQKSTVKQLIHNTDSLPLHLQLALECEGIQEQPKGSNRGDSVDAWNRNFGLVKVPWCATFIGSKLEQANAQKQTSARSGDYAQLNRAYKLSDVIYVRYHIKSGHIRVKKRPGGGHVDFIINDSLMIGGNVSDMVKIRKYTIQSMIADRTTHIVPYE